MKRAGEDSNLFPNQPVPLAALTTQGLDRSILGMSVSCRFTGLRSRLGLLGVAVLDLVRDLGDGPEHNRTVILND